MGIEVILIIIGSFVVLHFLGKYVQDRQEQRIADRVSQKQYGGDWQLRREIRDLRHELARRDNEIEDLRRRLDDLEKPPSD